MKFGIQHGIGDPNWQIAILKPKAVISFAKAAEKAGYTHIAFTEHPAPSSHWVNAGGEGVADLFTALGFCAAVTEQIGILTCMIVVPYHNPFATAHRIATLDVLSEGRLTLGLGAGYLKSEFFALGSDFNNRCKLFEDNLEIIKTALTGESVTAQGPGFSAKSVQVLPPVVQRPHPPIWIHGNSQFGIEQTVRSAQGWVAMLTGSISHHTLRTKPIPDLDALEKSIGDMKAHAEKVGRDPREIKIVASLVVPILDKRKGWNREDYQERFGRLEAMGVETVIVSACGDDPLASEESAIAFAEDFID